VSGTTRTPLVTLKGYFPPLANVISTKNAVLDQADRANIAKFIEDFVVVTTPRMRPRSLSTSSTTAR
jgi:hypothetical protein